MKGVFSTLIACFALVGLGCSSGTTVPTGTDKAASQEAVPADVSCEDAESNYPPECKQQLCTVYGCGEPDALMDGNGCFRKWCDDDTDCAGQTRCTYVLNSSAAWSVIPDTGECQLVIPSKLSVHSRCMPSGSSNPDQECRRPDLSGDCMRFLCEVNGCGRPESALDKYGCYRPSCEDDADCDDLSHCVLVEHRLSTCGDQDPQTGISTWHEGEAVEERFCLPR